MHKNFFFSFFLFSRKVIKKNSLEKPINNFYEIFAFIYVSSSRELNILRCLHFEVSIGNDFCNKSSNLITEY